MSLSDLKPHFSPFLMLGGVNTPHEIKNRFPHVD